MIFTKALRLSDFLVEHSTIIVDVQQDPSALAYATDMRLPHSSASSSLPQLDSFLVRSHISPCSNDISCWKLPFFRFPSRAVPDIDHSSEYKWQTRTFLLEIEDLSDVDFDWTLLA